MSSALEAKLEDALKSRDERNIRRRLPHQIAVSSSANLASDQLTDFSSNDYLSFTTLPRLRDLFLEKLHAAPEILGSGGSRLLVPARPHAALETRLAAFLKAPAALLFNSGFDANVGFFASVPQEGDVIVYDEMIHASVHDGMRASRAHAALFSFEHNSVKALERTLRRLVRDRADVEAGGASVFVAVESLYSMDGTFAPLREMVEVVETMLPRGNGHIVVDEAHCTGVYGPRGRGRVVELGLEKKVLARLHTFGKALGGNGAALLTTVLIRDYLLNYARSLIYTTSLTNANVIAVDCSFDLMEDGTASKLASHLLDMSTHFVESLRPHLASIPSKLLSLPPHILSPSPGTPPSPIIPLHTCSPRPLSAYLASRNLAARAITWPTVPKGKDRVRICLHAGHKREDVDRLVSAILAWTDEQVTMRRIQKERELEEWRGVSTWMEAKL
ncbi:PLP-dependent transferase [Coniophora puteana RWD-64-598 SS2]|uniref:PLP-dependent transferase n=1 Tax=Coniophora puteana (strain RWD-64-598) TaxID=741705 RepID=A0A5M3MXA3_CONPW|nr:PLP-dependent transferase [Coniophora puteana RWD-64-598 SS2]EIW83793.1 PLP-dependent transferase [Coniophora puteana RWD-64-598 SS2]